MDRPVLSIRIRADIETAKHNLFESKERFKILFLPGGGVAPAVARLAEALNPSGRTNAPRQRMPSALHLEIEDFTGTLFDIEAQHYLPCAPDPESLRAWLTTLAEEVSLVAHRQIADERLDFHLSREERGRVVAGTLTKRVDHWVKVKATPPSPPRIEYAAPSPIKLKGVFNAAVLNPESPAPAAPDKSATRAKTRLPGYVQSAAAAAKMDAYLRDNNILQRSFSIAVHCNERTLRRFRKTGKIRHDTLCAIAREMKMTVEQLQDK